MSYSRIGWLRRLRERKLDKPYSLPLGHWRRWDKAAKAEHPVWYFLLETVPEFVDDVVSPPLRWMSDLKYWFLYRFHPRHRYHMLKMGEPRYTDPGDLILPANFALLERYIDEQGGVYGSAERIDWLRSDKEDLSGQIWHEAEALALWLWWTIERPARVDPWDSVGEPEDVADGETSIREPGDPTYSRRQYNMITELEAIYERDDEEQLIRLIKIRGYLWT